jgi:hypothetical protein
MKKLIILLAGTMFVVGATLCPAATPPKQEKQAVTGGVPKQDTIHIGVKDKDKKDAAAAKTDQKAPAAPEQKAVTGAPPAPADTKAQDTQPTKKAKKDKKSKKTKKAPQN